MANTTNIIPNKLTMYQRVEGGVWHYRIKLKTGEALPEAFWEDADAYYSNELENTQGFRIFWKKYESAFAETFQKSCARDFQSLIIL